jgi:L-ascorbate metabolism protein UlaG (beta-lactamase superfamily)
MVTKRLRRDVRVDVRYDDRTPFGSPITARPEASVRELFAAVCEHVERDGFGDLVQRGPQMLADVVASDAFARVAEPAQDGAWSVRPEILYPAVADAPPASLSLSAPGVGSVAGPFPLAAWPAIHTLLAALAGPGIDDATPLGATGRLLDAMQAQGLVEDDDVPELEVGRLPLTFVGHNTVVVRSAGAAVIVDPWLVPGDASHPAGYAPLQLRDLGPLDAALITHSHPDHFAPGTLLQLPRNTTMIVPRVERETILAVAMAQRLRELGFTDIVELGWWERTQVGDVEVVALPFHGEQATDGEQLHPDVRNAGNTYFVRTPDFTAAFLADSGRDGLGDAREVAARARREVGSPDLLFAGYRGWLTYPVQHLFTSVARYLLFVPPHLWGVRMRIMTTADEVIDLAEIWGARHVVPYADGGAPWYWEAGLGPRLDGDLLEHNGFDPLPERVVQAARSRTEMPGGLLASTVEVLLVRPGDGIADAAGQPRIVRSDGYAWPYLDQLAPATAAPLLG